MLIKNAKEIKKMREGGQKLATVMNKLEEMILPGMRTKDIDIVAEKLILKLGGKPSFKGYGAESGNPFPATICASVNDEIVHGLPSNTVILKEGDIFKVDIGMKYEGFHTDMARSFAVGKVNANKERIIKVAKNSFYKGVETIIAGGRLSDYSRAVQRYVEKNGFSVVRDLVGHGIGQHLHEEPQIPNYYSKHFGELTLKSGMTFALEPMINDGSYDIVIGEDGWVFKTEDGGISAHWENTILITDDGVEILTELK